MNSKKADQSKVLKILLIIASVIFFLTLATFIGVYLDNVHSVEYDAEYLYYYLEDGDYARLYEMCCENRAYNVKPDADMLEIYAIADYYHNSFMYYAYKDSNPELAADYLKAMNENAANVNEFSFILEDIDERFAAYK